MDKKRVKTIIISLIIIAGIVAISLLGQEKIIEDFDVAYSSWGASSGGNRMLNITYSVQSGSVVSCEGAYFYFGTGGNGVEECNLTKLQNQEHPFKLERFITKYSTNEKLKGRVTDPPYGFSWEIILQ